ncbi:MAG: Asp-tRNA(Asn)/Glu-tRNA(Gln) amidotransferase subunit GatB [Chitinophagia bacterium]|jgi:aspartyl-tRNA(Asn)/glutamyl-tRNA(Gln) amidotransferase subunit B
MTHLSTLSSNYEAVIGLEIHAQLATKSKLFCGDATDFGAAPNTQISPITLGHPGTLPKTNEKAIESAIRMGLACGCAIEKDNYFARKNYFYPDLPKGYQISQHTTPICIGGQVNIKTSTGEKSIQLNRIHLEEDAGKSIHDLSETDSCIDLNRAGTPLIELVTEPCLHSAEEAFAFVTEIRKLVRWLGVCDGNMEEGSLRCDANISIRLKGAAKLGTRVEVKNLNSIRNIKKAIEFEIDRLIQITESGGTIVQQTRSFDANNDTTFSIRDKEDANDYRYFPDPDLAPFHLTEESIEAIRKQLPALPNELQKQWTSTFNLSAYDVEQLSENKEEAAFFIQLTKISPHYKAIANWILGPIRSYLNESNNKYENLSLVLTYLAELIEMVETNQLNFSVASTKVLKEILAQPQSPLTYATKHNLLQSNSSYELEQWVNEVLSKHPDKVTEYKKGKKGLIGLFVGEVKKISQGKADPKLSTQLLEKKLAE